MITIFTILSFRCNIVKLFSSHLWYVNTAFWQISFFFYHIWIINLFRFSWLFSCYNIILLIFIVIIYFEYASCRIRLIATNSFFTIGLSNHFKLVFERLHWCIWIFLFISIHFFDIDVFIIFSRIFFLSWTLTNAYVLIQILHALIYTLKIGPRTFLNLIHLWLRHYYGWPISIFRIWGSMRLLRPEKRTIV